MELLKLLRPGISDGVSYGTLGYGACSKKRLIATAIGAGLSVASSLIGGAVSASKERKARREAAAQHVRDDAWYSRRYNEDYADTAAGQRLISQAKEFADNNWKRVQGSAAVGGSTDAAVAMAKESGNKMVGNTLSNIAANDTARKSSIDAIKMRNDQNYSAQVQNSYHQQAANVSKAASDASNAMLKAGIAVDGYLDDKKES